jgi:hypothetical protein
VQAPTAAQYAAARRKIAEKREQDYTQVHLSSKVDVLISDVEKIMEEGPDKDTGCGSARSIPCTAKHKYLAHTFVNGI